ncbi:hypothetical protein SESBI_15012 [Sesbania bispinosa]|nr:hypothetical protein SESBI_15012 [Sesbania bispinosa]
MAESSMGVIRMALMGEVTIVTATPCCARSLAMSAMGIGGPYSEMVREENEAVGVVKPFAIRE